MRIPVALEVVMEVESVSPHNQFDATAASYLDANRLGWADDSQAFNVAITDGAYHTYRLTVDDAAVAHLSIDGAPALIRSGFVFNGTIALGDQTNDRDVDGAVRIRSVTRLCP